MIVVIENIDGQIKRLIVESFALAIGAFNFDDAFDDNRSLHFNLSFDVDGCFYLHDPLHIDWHFNSYFHLLLYLYHSLHLYHALHRYRDFDYLLNDPLHEYWHLDHLLHLNLDHHLDLFLHLHNALHHHFHRDLHLHLDGYFYSSLHHYLSLHEDRHFNRPHLLTRLQQRASSKLDLLHQCGNFTLGFGRGRLC